MTTTDDTTLVHRWFSWSPGQLYARMLPSMFLYSVQRLIERYPEREQSMRDVVKAMLLADLAWLNEGCAKSSRTFACLKSFRSAFLASTEQSLAPRGHIPTQSAAKAAQEASLRLPEAS
jgi:hypothetical protein